MPATMYSTCRPPVTTSTAGRLTIFCEALKSPPRSATGTANTQRPGTAVPVPGIPAEIAAAQVQIADVPPAARRGRCRSCAAAGSPGSGLAARGGIVRTRRCLSGQTSFSWLVSRSASAASSMPSYSRGVSRTSIAAAAPLGEVGGTRGPCAAARGRSRRSPARLSQPIPRKLFVPEREVLSGDGNVGGDLPVPALQVADLGVAGLVVDEVVAGRAVPAGLEKGAARSVLGGFRRVGVPGSPVR